MKKIFTILMALMIIGFTQCKNPVDNNKADGRKVKISCTIPINKGDKSDFANLLEDGTVNWSTGTERIYLAIPNETNPQIVELSAYSTLQTDKLIFESEIEENLLEDGKEYEVWYLGNSKNLDTPYITETKKGDVITNISGTIENQSGNLSDLGYCHIAKTKVTAVIEDDEITLPIKGILQNQMSIAYLDLKGISKLSGNAIIGTDYKLQYDENTNKYDFVVTENASATINITNGTDASFVVLLPNVNNGVVLKSLNGGYEFKNGVENNKFYFRYTLDSEIGVLEWNEMIGNIEVETYVVDKSIHPYYVGGMIYNYDESIVKKGIIVSSDENKLYYDWNVDCILPFLEDQYHLYDNGEKSLSYKIIDCTNYSENQFNVPLTYVYGNKKYYIRAFVINDNDEIIYGNTIDVVTENFNRDNRSPDYANVFWSGYYTLFDLATDEYIDSNYYSSTNENPTYCGYGSGYSLVYKFKTSWNHKIWYNHKFAKSGEIAYVPLMNYHNGKLHIIPHEQNENENIEIYYTINENGRRPESFTQKYEAPLELNDNDVVYCYAKSKKGNVSYTNVYIKLPSQ